MMFPTTSEVKRATDLGAYLKATADKRGPMQRSRAFNAHKTSQFDDAFKIDIPPCTVVDINELLGRPSVKAALPAALGNGGATFPREAGERSDEQQEIATKQLLTTCSTAPRRWNLLDKIQFLCRPVDRDEKGPAVCGCGYPADTADSVNIHLRGGEDGRVRAGVSGIYRCKSPWLCPTCSPAAAKVRSDRVSRAVEACYDQGGCVALVTLTAHHSLAMPLAEGKRMIAGASRRARSGRDWVAVRDEHSVLGVIIGQETTISQVNGWHYHQHGMVFTSGSAADAEAAGQAFKERYTEAVEAAGGRISKQYGVKVEVAQDKSAAADYASKGSMAWEVGGGLTKTQTKASESMTPWELAELAFAGDRWARDRWAEYIEVMPGTRSCVITPSLKKALGLADEPDDDEAEDGEQQHHDADEVVGRLAATTWRCLMKAHLAGTFLAHVESKGEAGFEDVARWATDREAEAADRIAEAKALRAESKARFEEVDLARRRRSAIEFEARRLVDCECGRLHGRTIDAVRLAAENVAAVLPNANPPSVSEILAAMARVRERRAVAA